MINPFEKENYGNGETISCSIQLTNDIADGQYEVIIVLTKVFDWFDESIKIINKCEIKNNTLSFSFINNLETGLYTFIKVEEKNNIFSVGNNSNENLLGAFKVNGNNKNSIEQYYNIYNMREKNFNRIKDISKKPDAELYSVFVFCKNILVSTVAQYDDVEVIPYDYLKCKSELEYINSFLENVTSLKIVFKEDKFDSSFPCAVYLIKNIKADSYDEAEEYAVSKISLLNNIYTVLLKSHGHFFALVTLNESQKISRLKILNTRYKGNLLLFADQGHNTLNLYRKLFDTNSYLNVYIKLLNDAIDEENRMMKYYRYWNILEGIAEHYNFDNNDMQKWDGTIVINGKGENVKVGTESLNRVFELIRVNYSSKKEKDFLGNLDGLVKVKDFLSICYQRRCCCAHKGENCINDSSKCNKKTEQMCLKYNIIHKENPLSFQDIILRRLEDVVIDILKTEINSEVGKSDKIDEYVSKIIK